MVVRFLIKCCSYWHLFRGGGNQWAGWPAYLSFFKDVVRLDLPEYARFAHYQLAAEYGGPRFMHREFWIVSDFPTTVGRDVQNRAHSDTGPSIAWRDGWAVYTVHGVRVPADVVECPSGITVQRIQAEDNIEIRRVMLQKYGEARYLQDIGGAVVHSDEYGTLYRVERPGDTALCMVRVENSTPEADGTRKIYWLRCHPELRPLLSAADELDRAKLGKPQELTARNAVASTFGLRGEDYFPQIQT
jgi:hypothetical protein